MFNKIKRCDIIFKNNKELVYKFDFGGVAMSYYKKILGENVYLSPATLEDAEVYTKWMNDFNITDYTGASSNIYSLEKERDWLEDKLKYSSNKDILFDIVAIDGDRLLGNISLIKINYIDRSAELGILIGENDDRSKGYGTEAIKLLLDFAFNYLNLNNIGLTLIECNSRAKRCYEKAGFKEYGRRRKAVFVNGKYYDKIYMDVLAEEFKEGYIKNKNIK